MLERQPLDGHRSKGAMPLQENNAGEDDRDEDDEDSSNDR